MLLHSVLQEYLVENDYLPLLATGQLTIHHVPAQLHQSENTLVAPVSQVSFSEKNPSEAEMQKLILFVANRLGVTNSEANDLLEKESVSNRLLSESSNAFNWPALGLFQNKNGSIHFVQDVKQMDYLPSLIVKKTMRHSVSEPAISFEHVEPERIVNNVVFQNEEIVVRDYWWVWALVIFLLSAILILFRFA